MSIARKSSNRNLPIHPGEFLREDFMQPLGLSAKALAEALHVPINRVSAIAREKRGINAEMALRLGRYFGMTPDFWMKIQARYELERAKDVAAKQIMREVQPGPHLKAQMRQELS